MSRQENLQCQAQQAYLPPEYLWFRNLRVLDLDPFTFQHPTCTGRWRGHWGTPWSLPDVNLVTLWEKWTDLYRPTSASRSAGHTLDVFLTTGPQPCQKSTVQDCTRHRWDAVSIHPHYGFVCGRHDAAWQPRSRNPQDWDLGCLEATGWAQESSEFLDAAVQLLHVHGAVCWYTVLLEHKVVARHSAHRWQ